MTIEQVFVIRDEVLKVIDSENLLEDLNREIEQIVAPSDDGKTAISLKREIIGLICSIEMAKIRFLRGEVRANWMEIHAGRGHMMMHVINTI